jgi:hypothetical protein
MTLHSTYGRDIFLTVSAGRSLSFSGTHPRAYRFHCFHWFDCWGSGFQGSATRGRKAREP